MADLQKKLKLVAELDDKKVKRQISQLKKDLEGLSLKGQDLSAFNKSANALQNAAKELKDAVGQFNRISPDKLRAVKPQGVKSTQGTGRTVEGAGQQQDKPQPARKGGVEPSRRQQTQQTREFFDPEARGGKGRRVKLRGQEEYSQVTQSVYKDQQQRLEAERKFKLKTQELIEKKQQQAYEKRRRQMEQDAQADVRRRERSTRGGLTAAGRQIGMQLPVARQVVESAGGMLPGGFVGLGQGMGRRAYRGMRQAGFGRGTSRGAVGALGMASRMTTAAGVGVGATAMGASAVRENIRTEQEFRATEARREQEQSFALLNRQGLTAEQMQRARQRGEQGLSGVAGGIGNVLSMRGLSALGVGIADPEAGGRQLQQLYRTGRMQMGQQEIETREQEFGLALRSGQRARQLRDVRFQNLRGGNITSQELTQMQDMSARQGYAPQETQQQFGQAREFLGNRDTMRTLPQMQSLLTRTNVGVQAQAQATEVFTGAERGEQFEGGFRQMKEVLKEGVASGLDTSKVSQFLKTTADYVQQQQGLGQISTERISRSLSNLTAGFAGGGDITQTHMRQARILQQRRRQESNAMSGVAGLGNIMGITQTFEEAGANLDTGTFMSLANLSADAKPEDVQTILEDADLGDVSEEKRKQLTNQLTGQLLQGKKGNVRRAGEALFGGASNTRRGMMSMLLGTSTEQHMGRRKAARRAKQREKLRRKLEGGKLQSQLEEGTGQGVLRSETLDVLQGGLPGRKEELEGRPEMASRVAESLQAQQEFVQGMEVMKTRTSDTAENLKDLNEQLKKVTKEFVEFHEKRRVERQGGGG